MLGYKPTKSSDYMMPSVIVEVTPIYGILSPIFYNLYKLRTITKKMKKIDKTFSVVDQAVKITINAIYGSFSKRRGNLLNELSSAFIFYYANMLLVDVIKFVNYELKREVYKKYGVGIKVVYGDTDSIFIANVPKEAISYIEKRLDQYIKEKYGRLFSIKVEGYFDKMLLSRRKHGVEPLKKSYLLFKEENGELNLVDLRGVFYKIDALQFIKDRRSDIFEEIVAKEMSSKELSEKLLDLAKSEVETRPYSLFYSKTQTVELKTEDIIRVGRYKYRTVRLKRLNRIEHFVVLYKLYLLGFATEVEANNYLTSYATQSRHIKVKIDVEDVERSLVIVDVNFIPISTRGKKRFIILVGKEGDKFVLHDVTCLSLSIYKEESNGIEEEKGYIVEFSVREIKASKEDLIRLAKPEIDKFVKECENYIINLIKGGVKL